MKKEKKNFLASSVELDKKKTRGDKLFIRIGLSCGIISIVMWVFILIMHTAAPDYSIATWFFLFWPLLIVVVVGLVISIGQLFRNHHISTIISAILCIISAIALIVIIIAQPIIYGHFYVLPFYFI